MSPSRVLETIREIWPATVDQQWMAPTILSALSQEIARFKLQDEQIRNIMVAHCLNDVGAANKPKTEKLIARLKAVVEAEADRAPNAQRRPGDNLDWISSERKKQSETNPAAWDQPAWKIVAAWFDSEIQNSRRERLPENRILDAGRSMASILQMYGAGYNDAVYSACAILGCDPVELDKDIQDHLLISREARLVSQKKISRMIAGAV